MLQEAALNTTSWLAHSTPWEVIVNIIPGLAKQEARTGKKSDGPELSCIIQCTLSIFSPIPFWPHLQSQRPFGSPASIWSYFHTCISIYHFCHHKFLRTYSCFIMFLPWSLSIAPPSPSRRGQNSFLWLSRLLLVWPLFPSLALLLLLPAANGTALSIIFLCSWHKVSFPEPALSLILFNYQTCTHNSV